MAFAFLLIGLVLITVGVRGQASNAAALLKSEFLGSNSFAVWFVALFLVGAIGYWKPAKPFSDGFLGLIILSMIIADQKNAGLFAKFNDAIRNPTAPAVTPLGNGQGPSSLSTLGNTLNETSAVARSGPNFVTPASDATNPFPDFAASIQSGFAPLTSTFLN